MNAADRIALILGRSIIRAETLEAELAAALARIAELGRDLQDGEQQSKPPE